MLQRISNLRLPPEFSNTPCYANVLYFSSSSGGQAVLESPPTQLQSMSCKPPKPFWLYAIELRELHKLPDMEQAADELWAEMPEDGRFFYRQCSKGLVAEPAKAAFMEPRRSSLANPAPNPPASTEILRVKLAVANMKNREHIQELSQRRREKDRLAADTAAKIDNLTKELDNLRTSSDTSSGASSCEHGDLQEVVNKMDDWHEQTSLELAKMRNERIVLVKEKYKLLQELKTAKNEIAALKLNKRHMPLDDWPED